MKLLRHYLLAIPTIMALLGASTFEIEAQQHRSSNTQRKTTTVSRSSNGSQKTTTATRTTSTSSRGRNSINNSQHRTSKTNTSVSQSRPGGNQTSQSRPGNNQDNRGNSSTNKDKNSNKHNGNNWNFSNSDKPNHNENFNNRGNAGNNKNPGHHNNHENKNHGNKNNPGHHGGAGNHYRPAHSVPPPGAGSHNARPPRQYRWERPVPPPPPRYNYVRVGVPSINAVLGLTFGSLIDYGITSLLQCGYQVIGTWDNIVYLNNVTQFGITWPEASMYYDTRGLTGARFQYSSYSATNYYYRSAYSQLCAIYGSPVSATNAGNIITSTWWGGSNTGYITLQYGPGVNEAGARMYYTDLIYGTL